jgi:hypothetical protein
MTITGDIARLGRIASGLASLADVPRIAQPLAADRIEALIGIEFDAGVDPYGEPWVPLADATIAKGRHAPPLTDTRELRGSVLAYPSEAGLRVSVGTADHPAGPHQDGWSGPRGSGPARPILPTRGMPESWQMAIDDSIGDAVIAKMREAGEEVGS